MDSPGKRLKADWQARGARARPGASEGALAGFEARHGVRLPADLRDYFATVDGMDAFDDANLFGRDGDLFRFWPLAEVERADRRYAPDRFLEDQGSYFLFADHSLRLPSYAIRLEAEAVGRHPVLAIYGDGRRYETSRVADSFSEFAARYLAGRDSRMDLGAGFPNSTAGGSVH